MSLAKTRFTPPLSLVIALAVVTVFILTSFAAPAVRNNKPFQGGAQNCQGTLTIRNGSATINGNEVQTGATILTGSVIATSPGSGAFIALGALGRLELGGGTPVTFTCDANTARVQSSCPKMEIYVVRGQVSVGSVNVTADHGRDFDGPVEVTMTSGAVFRIDCERNRQAAGPVPIGSGLGFPGTRLGGLLPLVGVGAEAATVAALTGGENGSFVVSPTTP